ncbi:MAG TPA: T9SS type A sorting domain-containing protein [Prolixibacteraceae bacterium]|nr:T9SS type A sorting domain-containing protein [Prolixibacteraceae bacterium]HOS00200.1 T9SS type A sorting domain-containing protein [Prolixibacteraceae bacterium]HPL45271.1 T9SS type A sorting domain-containing protein [Prolixibacteraceae bacterium]
MKKVCSILLILSGGFGFSLYGQLNTGTGVVWGELSPSEPLVLNENFQGFDFFHTDPDPDKGNSDNSFDDDGTTVIYGYKNDTVEVPVLGGEFGTIRYYFYQCAFAPAWKSAYAFSQETSNSANVSDGFVEISRNYSSTPPTVHGWFIADLRALEFVEVIQWSHSSTGGNKRGVMCEFSIDNGESWDTLRYQPGGAGYAASFTKDVVSREKSYNGYRCDPSAFGMTWEDGIWAENIMLRFGEAGGQTPRIHDLKVYGTPKTTPVREVSANSLKIYGAGKRIRLTETADVVVCNLSGMVVKTASHTALLNMEGVPDGIYVVKARAGENVTTAKVLLK